MISLTGIRKTFVSPGGEPLTVLDGVSAPPSDLFDRLASMLDPSRHRLVRARACGRSGVAVTRSVSA